MRVVKHWRALQIRMRNATALACPRALITPAMVSKYLTLHLATNRDVVFHVGDDRFPGLVPVNKGGGNRDQQDNQRKQREKHIEGERARPLGAVNPQKLFNGDPKDEPNPTSLPSEAGLAGRMSEVAACGPGGFTGSYSVGRTPSRWRAARYWVLIISLIAYRSGDSDQVRFRGGVIVREYRHGAVTQQTLQDRLIHHHVFHPIQLQFIHMLGQPTATDEEALGGQAITGRFDADPQQQQHEHAERDAGPEPPSAGQEKSRARTARPIPKPMRDHCEQDLTRERRVRRATA